MNGEEPAGQDDGRSEWHGERLVKVSIYLELK